MFNANATAFYSHTNEELEFLEQAFEESKIPDDIDTADDGPDTVFYTVKDHLVFKAANAVLIAK
jgi:hypothetical protein